MSDTLSLNQLCEGQWGVVHRLTSLGSDRRRLQDIGLIEGTAVCRLQSSPAGDPIAYLIRGAVIALRLEDSAGVLVRPQ